MVTGALEDRVSTVQRFNRFFTRRMGILRGGLLHTSYSLTEARIILELAHCEDLTASDLVREMGLDAGYLSRILSRFEHRGLISKMREKTDARRRLLRLTPAGQEAFKLLNERARDEIGETLNNLTEEDQHRLLNAMHTIESILDDGFKLLEPFILRSHEPGDMGWVVHRHGALYAEEYGWDEHFEALVAGIVAEFINNFNPARERCWIAEMDGERVGSVFVVQTDNEKVAKLRMLLVEPRARNMGLGTRLVRECIRFSKRMGYETLELWTNSLLVEARHIYEKAGFKLVAQEAEHSFGHDLVEEMWELIL